MHQVLYDRRLFSVPYTITNCVALRRLVIGSAITKLYGCVAATRQCEDDSRVDDGMVGMLLANSKSIRQICEAWQLDFRILLELASRVL